MIKKLAVYGTLRNGKRKTCKVDGYSLVYPGHYNYPAAIIDNNSKGMVVEVVDVLVVAVLVVVVEVVEVVVDKQLS